MFSHRVASRIRKNHLAFLLEDKRQKNIPVLDLTESNPTRVGFSYPTEEILAALSDHRSLVYQPSSGGLREARIAVAEYYRESGQRVAPEDVLLTASTSEAYAYLFKLLLDPDQNFLAPQPGYPLLDFLAASESVGMVPYPLIRDHGWQLHPGEIADRATPQTRAVVTVNPNNPTGNFLKASEWSTLKEICFGLNLPIICDQVFFDYPLDETISPFNPVGQEDILTFVLGGLSKVVGLPQMKLGWIVIRGPRQLKHSALRRLEIIADTFLSVNTPVQHAASRLLKIGAPIQAQIRQRIRNNLNLLNHLLSGSSLDSLPVEGGWYAVVRVPMIRSEEKWAVELLDRYDTRVYPGYFFDFHEEAFLVLSLLPKEEIFRRGIDRLLEAAS